MVDDTPKVLIARAWPAVLAAALFAAIAGARVSMADSLGYDESMHALLPAARMLLGVQAGDGAAASEALLGCQQYPFVYPLFLSFVQAFTGISELACRVSGRVVWACALLGLFFLTRELAAGISRDRLRRAALDEQATTPATDGQLRWAPWIAMGLAAASPLGLAYSGTLFLEVPFTAIALWASWAWLRRRADAPRACEARRDYAAGAWLAAAFFTKFNYGGMLALAFAIDFALEAAPRVRQGALADCLRSAARLALVPALAGLWWFVLPLPGGSDVGAAHREAFLGFLAGNQDLPPYALRARLIDWGAGVFVSPRAWLLALFAACWSLRFWRVRALRSAWVLALCCIVPVALHPFHLDRVLLPGAVFLWLLAALGIGSMLPARAPTAAASLLALTLACGLRPDWDAQRLMDWSFPAGDRSEEIQAYRREVLLKKIELSPARSLPTAGLARADSERLLDALAAEAGPNARIGWLGAPSKLSPCALHVGLLARNGSHERFLANARDTSMFGASSEDPGWDAARLQAFAAGFDVIFASDPPDLGGNSRWAFLAGYRERLRSEAACVQTQFAQLQVGTRTITLFALRRSP